MSPGRFFLAVPLQSPYMLGGLALVVVLGMAELVLAPSSGQDAVVTLLLLQMFSASSGFAIPARRGHYDAILTGGSSRTAVVGWHLVMSVAPGLVGWLVLGACELGVGRSVVLSGGSIAAMVMVSAAGWAVTVPLPRLSGGVVWLVLLLAGLGWPTAWREDMLTAAAGGADLQTRAVVHLLYPLAVAGRALTQEDVVGLLPAMALAMAGCVVAWRWLVRMDVPLEAAQ
jgi:hypothetical protein